MLNDATAMKFNEFYHPFICERDFVEAYERWRGIGLGDEGIFLEFEKCKAAPSLITNAIYAIFHGVCRLMD